MKEINYQIIKKANSGDQEAINFIKSHISSIGTFVLNN